MKFQQVLEPSGKRTRALAVSPLFTPHTRGDPMTARAVANIAEWSTYLPQDCVEAMIRDGWHLTA